MVLITPENINSGEFYFYKTKKKYHLPYSFNNKYFGIFIYYTLLNKHYGRVITDQITTYQKYFRSLTTHQILTVLKID